MKKKNHETVGKVATELASKTDYYDSSTTVIDQRREMLKGYEKELLTAIENGKKSFDGDFYVVVETKKERLLPNVIRNYFITRLSCPTPNYDQIVYKYHSAQEGIEFLWVVPSHHTCLYLYNHAHEERANEEKQLVQFVLDFYNDTLLKKAKVLNNEYDLSI